MKNWCLTLAVLLLGLMVRAASACPMCKDSVENADTGGGLPNGPTDPSQMSGGLPGGFNVSVYLMLVGLFCCLALVGWTLYKGIRNTPTAARGFPVGPAAAPAAKVVRP